MPPGLLPALLVLVIAVVGPACLLATRAGLVVPFAFIAAYVLAVGAVEFINIGVFDMVDGKFRHTWISAWLVFYWPLTTVFFVPSAISALLACWFARPLTRRDAATLLGVYLLLVLVAIEAGEVLGRHLRVQGPWPLVGVLALLSTIFFAMASVRRVAQRQERELSRTQ